MNLELIDNILTDVAEGNTYPLDAVIELEQIRKELENGLEKIKAFKYDNLEELSIAAKDHGGKYKGFEITQRAGRKTWNFKGVPEWSETKNNLKNIEKKYKSMFQAKQNGSQFANVSEDGEELPLPEIKYSKSSIIIKKAKK